MFKALKPYSFLIIVIALLSLGSNGLSLYFPKKLGEYVDLYRAGSVDLWEPMIFLSSLAVAALVLAFIQSGIAAYTSEKAAFDFRAKLIGALKKRSFTYMRDMTGGRLITVMTSDVDAIKNLLASGIISILTAGITVIGVVFFLLFINWKLALITLSIIPFILIVFGLIFGKVGVLFGKSQENLDRINKVINESIVASALVRVLNANKFEINKFDEVNTMGTEISQKIVTYFAALIPIITILSNIAILLVLWFGGQGVMKGTFTLGQMTAFFAYTSAFVWPFFVLGFAGTFVSRAQVSFKRINEVLEGENVVEDNQHHPVPTGHLLTEAVHLLDNSEIISKGLALGSLSQAHSSSEAGRKHLQGHIIFDNVTLKYGDKTILKDISFEIKPHTKTAILGPTGAGKTELFYLMAGLATPTEGKILIDGKPIQEWDQSVLLAHIGMVFQDSIVFNTSLKENILFKSTATDEDFEKAVSAAELQGLIKELPEGTDTNVAERGTTLSGGQKQRLTLARALALNPTILLLDDFTARVDAGTEERILNNIQNEFKDITLISITQKIEPVKNYDHIIVLMEGELIAEGKHQALLASSMEYQQIYESQMTTEEHI